MERRGAFLKWFGRGVRGGAKIAKRVMRGVVRFL